MPARSSVNPLVDAARHLSGEVERLRFRDPIRHVYNPLAYAWPVHEAYLRRFGIPAKRVLFLGMNPGPFGMVQTGVPFGEIQAVRDWMGLDGRRIGQPASQHPRRPVTGFACPRSEVSGRRLWGLFAHRFGPAQEFFKDHFVANYCPLAFLEESGRNFTPDKLPAAERIPLLEACDRHLERVRDVLRPEWMIGVGDFAEKRLRALFDGQSPRIGKIAHPSPASPAANRDWAGLVTRQLQALKIW